MLAADTGAVPQGLAAPHPVERGFAPGNVQGTGSKPVPVPAPARPHPRPHLDGGSLPALNPPPRKKRRRLAPAKECTFPGCQTKAFRINLCRKHGANGTCSVEGCTRNAVKREGRCAKHGPYGSCNVQGCTANAKKTGGE